MTNKIFIPDAMRAKYPENIEFMAGAAQKFPSYIGVAHYDPRDPSSDLSDENPLGLHLVIMETAQRDVVEHMFFSRREDINAINAYPYRWSMTGSDAKELNNMRVFVHCDNAPRDAYVYGFSFTRFPSIRE
jgi:hypothetical protein